jgi:hypothetical protein
VPCCFESWGVLLLLFLLKGHGLYGSGWVSQCTIGDSRGVCDGGHWLCLSDGCHGV